MYNVAVKDDPVSEELSSRLKIECIIEVMKAHRLHWFGHVERRMGMSGDNDNDGYDLL